MKILFDTNVVLDVLLNRTPWVNDAKVLWQAIEENKIEGFLMASTLTDIHYIVRKASSLPIALQAVGLCLQTFEIVPLDRNTCQMAFQMLGNDFEDNLQLASAIAAGLDGIVTRDAKGFASAHIKVWTPADLLQQI